VILLGPIVNLQVQTVSLKIGEGVKQRFDNSGLQVVDQLELNDGGVRGFATGVEYADVHHRDHPQSKLRGTLNSISIGFTGHYDRMRTQFGEHFTPGVAAENILIDYPDRVHLADLSNGLIIETGDGQSLRLSEVLVAEPCSPFSRWALQFPDGEKPDIRVTQTLQFLGTGMRGFYCRYIGMPARIQAGDRVYLAD